MMGLAEIAVLEPAVFRQNSVSAKPMNKTYLRKLYFCVLSNIVFAMINDDSYLVSPLHSALHDSEFAKYRNISNTVI